MGAAEVLRSFARWCALDVIDVWEPDALVRRYLQTGNPDLRASARTSAQTTRFDQPPNLHSERRRNARRAAVRASYGPASTATPYRAARVAAHKARLAGASSHQQERQLGELLVRTAIRRGIESPALLFAQRVLRAAGQPLGLAEMALWNAEERSLALVWADAKQCDHPAPRPSFIQPQADSSGSP